MTVVVGAAKLPVTLQSVIGQFYDVLASKLI